MCLRLFQESAHCVYPVRVHRAPLAVACCVHIQVRHGNVLAVSDKCVYRLLELVNRIKGCGGNSRKPYYEDHYHSPHHDSVSLSYDLINS